MSDNGNIQLLTQDPDEVARRIAGHLDKLTRTATGDELVYSPTGRHSYYRDLIARQIHGSRDASERLTLHAEQMEHVRKTWRDNAEQRLRNGSFEYRVTPDRTDGYGGYFAPPLWLNQLFATANRPGRVLAGLMTRFALPPGISEIDIPIITTGTKNQPAIDDLGVSDQDFTDSSTASVVVPFAGQADVALQLLEQSPAGAHLDWAIFQDLSESYDEDLEVEVLEGIGGKTNLKGITNVSGIASVAFAEATPKGSKMWVALSKVAAQIGDGRKRPPECWLMRTARWAWLEGSEDTAERPFGLSTRFYLGSDDETPDPISGMMGWPVFLDDAISATLGTGANQDQIIALRPRELMLFEGEPHTHIGREPLSGALGVRLQMHCNTAALTARRPASIGKLTGTGCVVQEGY